MASQKRKSFSFEMKAKIIEEVEKKTKKKSQICREYNIPSGTLYTFLKDKDAILSALMTGAFHPDRKRLRSTGVEDLDSSLFAWYNQARASNMHISGPILQAKGEELAKELGFTDLKISRGWLCRFKSRHGISTKTVSGESASATTESSSDWKKTDLTEILEEYANENIFTASETGLFYKCLPNKTVSKKGEICTGLKVPRERLSILIAANMDGSQKLPLLMIGKFEKPHCLKKIHTLPVTYKANKKAWMTGVIFEEWVRKLDRKFLLEGRRIALIINSCSAHPNLTGLQAVRLVFLPPDTTSSLQGIIQNFKTLYRKRVLKRFISSVEEGKANSYYKMTILDAINFAAASWAKVRQETVAKCIKKAGFWTDTNEDSWRLEEEPEDMEIRNLFERAKDLLPGEQSLADYITIDDQLPTAEDLTSQEISAAVQGESSSIQPLADEIEDDDDETEMDIVSSKKAEDALETLRLFLQQHENTSDALNELSSLENSVTNIIVSTRKQSQKQWFESVNSDFNDQVNTLNVSTSDEDSSDSIDLLHEKETNAMPSLTQSTNNQPTNSYCENTLKSEPIAPDDEIYISKDVTDVHEYLPSFEDVLPNQQDQVKLYNCGTCSYSSNHLFDLYQHNISHTMENFYICDLCQSSYQYFLDLKCHMTSHAVHGRISYDRTENSRKDHKRKDGRPNLCEISDSIFLQPHHLKIHEERHTCGNQYSCDLCSYTCTEASTLKQHRTKHTGGKPYSCDLCDYTSAHGSNLTVHKRKHTGEKPYSCDLCDYTSAHTSHLMRHKRTHTGEKPYSCDLCDYTSTQISHLKRHTRKHTGERPYSCDLCSYTCIEASTLKRHKRTHTGEKLYSCDLCDYTSTQSFQLKRHKRKHTGEKPYSCDLCDYICAHLHHLIEHKRKHTGEKPYSCDLCSYTCAQSSALIQHKIKHTGEKPYSCDLCDYSGARLYNLKRHKRKHTGEKPGILYLSKSI